MAAAVCSPVSGTTRMLIRGIAAGRLAPLQQGVPALGTSGFKRRFHVSPVSQAIRSSMPDVAIPLMPITDFVFRDMKKYGDRPALVNALTGESYTFPQARDAIWRVASGLARHGVQQDDVVMVVSENCVEYVLTFHAVLSLGAVVTMANPIYLTSDIVNQAKDSAAKFIVSSQKCAAKSVSVKETMPQQIKKMFIYGDEPGCVPFSSLLEDDGSMCPLDVNFDPRQKVAMLPYSSGTTGMPKGVMLSHFAEVANDVQSDSPLILPEREGVVQLGLLPFYHIYAVMATFITSLSRGQTSVIVPGFDPRVFLEVVPKFKVSMSYVVPPIVMFLNKHPLVAKADLSSLNRLTCGAAALGREMIEEFRNRLPNCDIGQGYGLRETAPVISATPLGVSSAKAASAGIIVANTELKLVNMENGEECATNDQGEICVRGPQLMQGYLNNPAATAEMIDSDGWLHTGDVGYLDEDNYIHVADRLKELIKYKGLQVPPAELEAILCSHPAVTDAGVIGIPDADGGEVPRAYVALKHGATATPAELKQFVAEQVVAYKRLRGGVEILPEIPRSAAGKILRRHLKEIAKSPTTDTSTFSAAMME